MSVTPSSVWAISPTVAWPDSTRADLGAGGLTESGRVTDDDWVRGRTGLRRRPCPCPLVVTRPSSGWNPTLLQICSDWQMRRIGNVPELNDHTDPDYDAKVLSRLIRIDASAQRIGSDLASVLMRFGLYGTRLYDRTRAEPLPATPPMSPTPSIPTTPCGSSSTRTFWSRSGISREEERGVLRIGVEAPEAACSYHRTETDQPW